MLQFKIRKDNIIVLLGKRGSGKTQLIKFLIRFMCFSNTVIFDTIQSGDGSYQNINLNTACENIKVVKTTADAEMWDKFNDTSMWINKFVVIDELDMVNFYHKNFYTRWINVGRNFNSGGILSARRPTRLPRDTTANADYSILFQAHERSVIDYYKESFSDEVVDAVKKLDKYEFIIVDANTDIVGNVKLKLNLEDNTIIVSNL